MTTVTINAQVYSIDRDGYKMVFWKKTYKDVDIKKINNIKSVISKKFDSHLPYIREKVEGYLYGEYEVKFPLETKSVIGTNGRMISDGYESIYS